jgi:hypothetical protein
VTPPGTGTPPDGPARPGKRTQLSYDSWVFWWAYNRAEFVGLKDAIYRTTAEEGLAQSARPRQPERRRARDGSA